MQTKQQIILFILFIKELQKENIQGAPLHQRISVKNRDIWQNFQVFDKFGGIWKQKVNVFIK